MDIFIPTKLLISFDALLQQRVGETLKRKKGFLYLFKTL